MDLCIIVDAGSATIADYRDEVLFLHFKSDLLKCITTAKIKYFGPAPDNTADGNDDLLTAGTFFRIIATSELLNINLAATTEDVIAAFKNVVQNESLSWGTVIVDKGFITTETTIEFIF